MGVILPAPRLLLDTNHLVNIADMRLGRTKGAWRAFEDAYRFLDACIQKWHFGIVFAPCAALEWVEGRSRLCRAHEIAAVVDSAQHRYLAEDDAVVYCRELLKECAERHPGLSLPQLDVMHPAAPGRTYVPGLAHLSRFAPTHRAASMLLQSISELCPVPVPSARFCVDQAWAFKYQHKVAYAERIDGYTDALARDIRAFREGVELAPIAWMREFLELDKILDASNSGAAVDTLLESIDVEQCPAVRLWFAARLKRIRDGRSPRRSEVGDWLLLPIVPYVDLLLTDREFAGFLCSAGPELPAKVTASPKRAVEILRPWMELTKDQ